MDRIVLRDDIFPREQVYYLRKAGGRDYQRCIQGVEGDGGTLTTPHSFGATGPSRLSKRIILNRFTISVQ